MPSKPKMWLLADEDERHKIFRFEHPEKPDLWVEVRYSKVTTRWTAVRCAFSEGWHRWETPIKNHAVAKRRGFEFLLDAAFEEVHAARPSNRTLDDHIIAQL